MTKKRFLPPGCRAACSLRVMAVLVFHKGPVLGGQFLQEDSLDAPSESWTVLCTSVHLRLLAECCTPTHLQAGRGCLGSLGWAQEQCLQQCVLQCFSGASPVERGRRRGPRLTHGWGPRLTHAFRKLALVQSHTRPAMSPVERWIYPLRWETDIYPKLLSEIESRLAARPDCWSFCCGGLFHSV